MFKAIFKGMASNLLVLYGSETGTSQDLAEQIWREGYRRNVPVKVVPFDDFEMNVSYIYKLVFQIPIFRHCRNKRLSCFWSQQVDRVSYQLICAKTGESY